MTRRIEPLQEGAAPEPEEFTGALPESHAIRYEFSVPEKARSRPTDPKKIEVKELTALEEETAYKMAGDNRGKLAAELAKSSLFTVDGKRVNHGEGEGDFYWGRFGAKVRKLVLMAFADVHNTEDDVDANFLASRVVRSG